jgi:ubiquinone/menaquinone biosynthesis C-methylase UbiE
MEVSNQFYIWFYNKIHSRYYDVMIKWLIFPFGGEKKWRMKMLEPISFSKNETILDMCCGTGGATYYISEKAHHGSRVVGIDITTKRKDR